MFTIETLKAMTAAALATVTEHCEELSALDAATGDGDHGTAICQAMGAVNRSAQEGAGLKQALGDMGFAAMTESCGSTSTLIGALFLGMGDGVDGDELSSAGVAAMFAAGLANVRQQTKADIGGKTLMDALIPAVACLEESQSEGLVPMFGKAAAAAAAGAETTIEMVAKFGRARNLGERVVGHADAGAASMAYIFKAFANALGS
jgi:phosphoenolpyruvate---glycerone phosphotransferase subunit DhaL